MFGKILNSRVKFDFRLAVAVALLPAMAFSAPAVGKVRSALGTVDRIKIKQSEWSALRVGADVYQSDRVRTGVESEVIFGLPDGSYITIAENAEVEMTNLLEPNNEGGFETRLDIKKGHLNFAVPKLLKDKSKFIFKTGTATASIRGTEGYIGGEGVFFAGLKTGKLEISPNGSEQSVAIVAGETTFGTDSLVVLKLASSGEVRFAKKIEKLLADKSKNVADLIPEIQKADSTYQEELKEEARKAAQSLPENGFSVSTNSPVDVCDQGLMVEGFYRTKDEAATLILKVGNSYQSANLIRVADGVSHSFAQKVVLTDANGLWNVNKATLTFMSAGSVTSKTIDINVNKACSEVNTKAPVVTISAYDSLRCSATASVSEMQNDAGDVSVEMEGSPISGLSITKNAQHRVKLIPGNHEYFVRVKDQAGNVSTISKFMGCYPKKRFSVDVIGGNRQLLNPPPPPPGMDNRITQTLQFRIKMSENNPTYLYKVVVKQNGKTILQETQSQIQGLDYQIPVELNRESVNKFDIEVIHKSGYRVKAKKVYEVR